MTVRACAAVLVVALAGCGRAASGSDDPRPEPPERAHFERPAMVRFHMQRHFDDLHQIERLLVAGKLDEAKVRAFLLTQPPPDPGMMPWSADSADVVAAARALVAAPGIDEACRREARVAVACAACHARTQMPPSFAAVPAPADEPTATARMKRHQWAVDRLWEGLVAGSDRPWRSGLEVLSSTPLPFTPITDAPALAVRLRQLARVALAKQQQATETLDGRGAIYGEMLVTCAACHAGTRQR